MLARQTGPRFRPASESVLTRPGSQVAKLRLDIRHGDRVLVRDGSTRLSFFAVRTLQLVNQVRSAVTHLKRTPRRTSDSRMRHELQSVSRPIVQPLFLFTLCHPNLRHFLGAKHELIARYGRKGSWFEAGIVVFADRCQQRLREDSVFFLIRCNAC